MQKSRLIFIDDSGDPGLKNVSTDYLVMSAVIFDDPNEAGRAAGIMREFKYRHHMRPEYELKFNKLKKSLVKEILQDVEAVDFKVIALYSRKQDSNLPWGHGIYEWSISELLKIIDVSGTSVHIDGRGNRAQVRKYRTYIRQELSKAKIRAKEIKFEDSAKSILTQLADLVVGAVRRSIETGKTDHKAYIKIIQRHIDKVYRLDR